MNDDGPTDGELMGLVRKLLYVPNGKPPAGYSPGRDVRIIRALRKAGETGFSIAAAIEGVRVMCDRGELGVKQRGEKLTMRALYHTGHGVRSLLQQAQEATYKQPRPKAARQSWTVEKPKEPEAIGNAITERLKRFGL